MDTLRDRWLGQYAATKLLPTSTLSRPRAPLSSHNWISQTWTFKASSIMALYPNMKETWATMLGTLEFKGLWSSTKVSSFSTPAANAKEHVPVKNILTATNRLAVGYTFVAEHQGFMYEPQSMFFGATTINLYIHIMPPKRHNKQTHQTSTKNPDSYVIRARLKSPALACIFIFGVGGFHHEWRSFYICVIHQPNTFPNSIVRKT